MQILIAILMVIVVAIAGYEPEQPDHIALENYFNSITTHRSDFSQECNPENENLQFIVDEHLQQTAHAVATTVCADGSVDESELIRLAAHAEHRVVYIPLFLGQ